MAIQKHNITIRKYCKWTARLSNSSLDLTNYGAKMQIRSVKDNSLISELSTELGNGKIVISVAEGTITMTISSSETATFTEQNGRFDFLLKDSEGEYIPIFEGDVTIEEGVTVT